ncbi:hypothetical protein [Saccharothrix syringae]|uniref:Uncharacterized protein n=1 Tax=Saccharothrix syringae TaxID=103733 RepID=A0A5Q0H8S9_SACSY|nr:hypothetical protein [Saccharothrix syringae]QFZ22374.1 hypothetical protein EKG83_37570 [Saccharothrix syringae]
MPVARPNRAPLIALTALAALFAATTGLLTALYTSAAGERDEHVVSRAQRELALTGVAEQQEQVDQALADHRSRESALSGEHDLLTRCAEAAEAYFDLPPEQSPESSRLFRVMYDVCPLI